MFQSLGELIGAACAFIATRDAIKKRNQFVDLAVLAQLAHAHGIARATTNEGDMFDDIAIIGDVNLNRASAFGIIGESLFHRCLFFMMLAAAMAFFAAATIVFAAAFFVADFEQFAIDFATGVSGVAFVGIDMHGKGELGRDADDGVTEDGLSFLGEDADIDGITVFDAEVFGIFRGHMNMALGDDDAFFEL